ncbi:hypothetical protein [Nitratireductor sp. StC3]|uniref:hypothetical protein n=1 Tax=Nitratireductor sp. StC3 TaxID=2126741 RepID=UPI000D0DFA28|nr:hypothetical protein [Nitratireductor sp. StC3]PSM18290.1 hypothetical protein C7T96_10510 [Nitratireductor sp. StC3]
MENSIYALAFLIGPAIGLALSWRFRHAPVRTAFVCGTSVLALLLVAKLHAPFVTDLPVKCVFGLFQTSDKTRCHATTSSVDHRQARRKRQ